MNSNNNRNKSEGHSRLQRAYWLVIILVSIIGLIMNIYATFFRK